jgi:hypothetical protein
MAKTHQPQDQLRSAKNEEQQQETERDAEE